MNYLYVIEQLNKSSFKEYLLTNLNKFTLGKNVKLQKIALLSEYSKAFGFLFGCIPQNSKLTKENGKTTIYE